jgi:hypothetical protein
MKHLQLQCQECEKIFWLPKTKCPRCGSYDCDVTASPVNVIELVDLNELDSELDALGICVPDTGE